MEALVRSHSAISSSCGLHILAESNGLEPHDLPYSGFWIQKLLLVGRIQKERIQKAYHVLADTVTAKAFLQKLACVVGPLARQPLECGQ